MSRFILSGAAALSSVVLASSAVAESAVVVVSTRVAYRDLDLSTPTGARTMLHRIDAAAAALCAQLNSPLLPTARAAERRCRASALNAAVARLDAPLVTAQLRGESVGASTLASVP